MSAHTPEPWVVYRGPMNMNSGLNPFFKGIVALLKHAGEDDDVAVTTDTDRPSFEYEANARRIVACVNFCVGKPTEWLEQSTLDDLMLREYEGSTAPHRLAQAEALLRGLLSGAPAMGLEQMARAFLEQPS